MWFLNVSSSDADGVLQARGMLLTSALLFSGEVNVFWQSLLSFWRTGSIDRNASYVKRFLEREFLNFSLCFVASGDSSSDLDYKCCLML